MVGIEGANEGVVVADVSSTGKIDEVMETTSNRFANVDWNNEASFQESPPSPAFRDIAAEQGHNII